MNIMLFSLCLCVENMSLFEQAYLEKKLGHSDLLLKNIFIRSAAYEGMLDHGLPNQDLSDHHAAMARGSVALTTVSYGAVSADGRTFNTQMYINDRCLENLKVLAEEVRVHVIDITVRDYRRR